MSRKRTVNNNLPPRMIAVKRPKAVYFYLDAGLGAPKRYISLGSDRIVAFKKYAELAQDDKLRQSTEVTFQQAWDKFLLQEIPKKAHRTQADYITDSVLVLRFFGDAPLDQIKPMHIRQYLDKREAKVRGNREIALFSTVFNRAREWGLTDAANPAARVTRNKETGRKVYLDIQTRDAILAVAEPALADAIWLSYLTGQRPADVLKMRETDIREGCLEVRQNKTDAPLRIEISGKLAQVLDGIRKRKEGFKIIDTALVVGANGRAIKQSWIRVLWSRARDAAGLDKSIQYRDLRAAAASDVDTGRDIRQAQQLLGHSNVSTTERYARSRRGTVVKPTI